MTHVGCADEHCLDQQELEDFTYGTSWRETQIKGSVQRGFQQVTPLQVPETVQFCRYRHAQLM
jgi:hypothetical protein